MEKQDQSPHAKGFKFSERQQTNKPHTVVNLGAQQGLWSPTVSQHSLLPPSLSHSSAQTADFRTPCLTSRGSSSGRLAFVVFVHSPTACKEPSPVILMRLNYGFSNVSGCGHVDHTRQTPLSVPRASVSANSIPVPQPCQLAR